MSPEQADLLIQNQQQILQSINLGFGILSGLIVGFIFWNVVKEVSD